MNRPTVEINNAPPRLKDYILYLEKKYKYRTTLILKIQALEKEVKKLKTINEELKSLNNSVNQDPVLENILPNSNVEIAIKNTNVNTINESFDKLTVSNNTNVNTINESFDKLTVSNNQATNGNDESPKLDILDDLNLPLIKHNACNEDLINDGKTKNLDNNIKENDDNNDSDDSDNDDDDNSADSKDSDTDSSTHNDEDSGNSIIIKNVRKNYITCGLEQFILDISRSMNIKLCLDESHNDIKAVNERKRKFIYNDETNSIILFVCFSTRQMKINFLQHKDKLKKHPLFCSLEIEDYVSDRTFHLYRYAKILKLQYNYAAIFWRNNRVYAQKSKSIEDFIKIKSYEHVNELIQLEKK